MKKTKEKKKKKKKEKKGNFSYLLGSLVTFVDTLLMFKISHSNVLNFIFLSLYSFCIENHSQFLILPMTLKLYRSQNNALF
jgi:hypothetical protein